MQSINKLLFLLAASVVLGLGSLSPAVELPYTGSDLRLWLRADGDLTVDSAPSANRVITWSDYTGVGGNAAAQDGAGLSGKRPLWVANVLNGRPIVRFDSSAREVDGAAALAGGNHARTIIMVASNITPGDQSTRNVFDPNGQGTGATLFRITPEVGIRYGNGNQLYTSNPLGATASVVIAQLPEGGKIGDTVVYFNSSTPLTPFSNTNPTNPVATGMTGYLIGGTGDFRGDVAEVLAFDAQLSAAELDAIGAYLQLKYGLASSFGTNPTQDFFDGQGITDPTEWLHDGNWNTAVRPMASMDAYIGNNLTATIGQTGAKAQDVYVGHNTGTLSGDGTLTVDGAGASLTAKRLKIGTAGADGDVNFVRGTITLTGTSGDQSAYVGYDALVGGKGAGTFTMGTLGGNDADTTLVYNTGRFEISRVKDAAGTFILNSGTVKGTANFIVTQGDSTGGGTANVFIHGGSLTTTTDMNFNYGTGTLVQDGGRVSVRDVNQSFKVTSSITVDGGTFRISGNLIERAGASTINVGGTGRLDLVGNATTRDTERFNMSGSGVLQLGLVNNTTGVSKPLNVMTLGTFGDTPTVELDNRLGADAATTIDWVDGTNTWNDDPVGKWTGDVLPAYGVNAIATGSVVTVITSPNNMTTPGVLTSGTAGWTIDASNLKAIKMVRTGIPVGGPVTARISGATSIVSRNADLRIAPEAGADAAGLVLDSGASLTLGGASKLVIGGGVLGTVDQNGGTLSVGGDLLFGGGFGSQGGTYNLNGGALNVGGNIVEGASGAPDANVNNAQLYINGGTLTVAGDITVQRFGLGDAVTSDGASYTIPVGQTVYSTGATSIGSQGTNASLTVNGTLIADYTSWVAEKANSSGTLTVNPGATVTVNNTWEIGDAAGAAGTVILNGGTVSVNKGWAQATDATARADLTVEDGAVLNVSGGNFETAYYGTGTVTWRGGTLNQLNNNMIVGQYAGSDATFDMYGGELNLAGQLRVTNYVDVVGRLYLYGGTINVAGQMDTLNNAGTATQTTSAEIVVDHTQVGSNGPAVLNVGTNLVLGNGNAVGGTTQMDLVSGTVTVGNNLQLATGGSGQTATFNLSGGTLDMTGGNVVFGSGTAAFHFTDGVLKDVGTFGSTLTQNGGTLAPGGSIGTTTVNGDYLMNAGILEIEIAGMGTPGVDYDVLRVLGNAVLDGTLNTILVGPESTPGDYYDVLFATGTITENLAQSWGPLGESAWVASVIPNPLGGEILRLTAVPEPSGLLLAGSGLLCLALWGWRRARPR